MACLDKLLQWDRGDGRGKTFLPLAKQLKLIGRKQLAARLSIAVYHENAEQVRKKFLDNPLKDLLHTKSPLLTDDQNSTVPPNMEGDRTTTRPDENEAQIWTDLHSIALTLGILCIVVWSIICFKVCIWPTRACTNCKAPYSKFRAHVYQRWCGLSEPPDGENLFFFI